MPAKPLRPRGAGYTFRPDQRPCRAEKWLYRWAAGLTHMERVGRLGGDADLKRIYRKRQRRVDQYMIDLGLEAD